jgi:hypothetical protein
MTCSDTLAFTPYVCGESDVDENVSRNYALTPLRPNVTMDHLKVGLETGLHLEAATKRTICVCKELEGLPRASTQLPFMLSPCFLATYSEHIYSLDVTVTSFKCKQAQSALSLYNPHTSSTPHPSHNVSPNSSVRPQRSPGQSPRLWSHGTVHVLRQAKA